MLSLSELYSFVNIAFVLFMLNQCYIHQKTSRTEVAASRGLNRHFSLLSLLPKPLMQRSSSSGDDATGGFRKGGSRDSGRLKRFSQQFSLEGASSWQPFEVNDLPVGGVSVWSVCLPACSPRLFGCWCMTWHSSVRMRLCLHVSVRMSMSP